MKRLAGGINKIWINFDQYQLVKLKLHVSDVGGIFHVRCGVFSINGDG